MLNCQRVPQQSKSVDTSIKARMKSKGVDTSIKAKMTGYRNTDLEIYNNPPESNIHTPKSKQDRRKNQTHTHTHMYIYAYIYTYYSIRMISSGKNQDIIQKVYHQSHLRQVTSHLPSSGRALERHPRSLTAGLWRSLKWVALQPSPR